MTQLTLPYGRAEHMNFAPPSPNTTTTTTTFRRLKIRYKGLKSLSFDLKCREFYVAVSSFIFRNFFPENVGFLFKCALNASYINQTATIM